MNDTDGNAAQILRFLVQLYATQLPFCSFPILFAFWAFSLPERFVGMNEGQSADVISSFTEEVSDDAPSLSEIQEELKQIAPEPAKEVPVVIPNEFPTTTVETNERPIRLATTTPTTTIATQNSQ